MEADLIELRIDSGIATLCLNRPEKRNALNDELRAQLIAALEEIQGNRDVRALVLTGNGKVFCSGGDVAAMKKRFEAPAGKVGFNGWARQQRVHYNQSLLHNMPIPTIAAVNGLAAGLGADTALACDFILASTTSSFAWSYIHRGLIPDGGALYLLPRRIGMQRAKDLIYSGRTVDAEEALRIGVADRLSTPENLLADAQAWARQLGQGSKTALALGKSILNQSFELTAEHVFALGSQAQGICYTSSEHHDSVQEFLEKSAARKRGA